MEISGGGTRSTSLHLRTERSHQIGEISSRVHGRGSDVDVEEDAIDSGSERGVESLPHDELSERASVSSSESSE